MPVIWFSCCKWTRNWLCPKTSVDLTWNLLPGANRYCFSDGNAEYGVMSTASNTSTKNSVRIPCDGLSSLDIVVQDHHHTAFPSVCKCRRSTPLTSRHTFPMNGGSFFLPLNI